MHKITRKNPAFIPYSRQPSQIYQWVAMMLRKGHNLLLRRIHEVSYPGLSWPVELEFIPGHWEGARLIILILSPVLMPTPHSEVLGDYESNWDKYLSIITIEENPKKSSIICQMSLLERVTAGALRTGAATMTGKGTVKNTPIGFQHCLFFLWWGIAMKLRVACFQSLLKLKNCTKLSPWGT